MKTCGKCGTVKHAVNCHVCNLKACTKYYWRWRTEISARRKARGLTPEQRERQRAGQRRFYRRHRKEILKEAAAHRRALGIPSRD